VNIQSQIAALEELAAVDEELAKLEGELDAERVVLDEKKVQLDVLDRKLAAVVASVTEMERTRGELTGEARQMSLQMDRSREKLSRCRTEREANAAQREVEELRKLYRDREIEVQKLNGLIEQARVECSALEEQSAALASELGQSRGDAETKMGDRQSAASSARDRRAGLVKQVPPVLYRRYEMVRKHRGSGLARTTDGTCSACHIQLSPMLFQVLRRGESFDQCPSCQRLLYFRAATKVEAAATEEAAPGNGT
jgi:predicted  nucleic acid-binding Zn-ribbon protein